MAQEIERKGQFSIIGGPARPDSYYNGGGDEDGSIEDTEIGYNLQFSINYRLWGFFGLSVMYHMQSNGISPDRYEYYPNFNGKVKADVGDLKFNGLFVGPLFSFKLHEHFRLETRLMMAYASYSSPELTLVFEGPTETETYTRPVYNASALTLMTGIGIRYTFKSRFCALFNLEYITGRPDFSPVDLHSEKYGSIVQQQTYYPIVITINYNLGIGILF